MSVLQLALKHLDALSQARGVPPERSLGVFHGTLVPVERLEHSGTVGTHGTAERRCSVCGQLARFGYDVRLLHGEEGRWFCAAHRPVSGNA
jgi:hypothetical protein